MAMAGRDAGSHRGSGAMVTPAPRDLPFEVSVVACVQDQALPLAHWMVSLLEESSAPRWELIVVDRGSLDSTSGVLAELQGDIRTYRLPRDTRLPQAWWWAAQRAGAPLVLFVDVEKPPPVGTIGAMVEQTKLAPNASILRAPGSNGGLPFVVRPAKLDGIALHGPLDQEIAGLPCLGAPEGSSPTTPARA